MAGDLFAKELRVAERAEGVLAVEKDVVPRSEIEAIFVLLCFGANTRP